MILYCHSFSFIMIRLVVGEVALKHFYLQSQSFRGGHITEKEVPDVVWKNLLQGRLTFFHWNKGEHMAPTIGAEGGTLLVRKIAAADPT